MSDTPAQAATTAPKPKKPERTWLEWFDGMTGGWLGWLLSWAPDEERESFEKSFSESENAVKATFWNAFTRLFLGNDWSVGKLLSEQARADQPVNVELDNVGWSVVTNPFGKNDQTVTMNPALNALKTLNIPDIDGVSLPKAIQAGISTGLNSRLMDAHAMWDNAPSLRSTTSEEKIITKAKLTAQEIHKEVAKNILKELQKPEYTDKDALKGIDLKLLAEEIASSVSGLPARDAKGKHPDIDKMVRLGDLKGYARYVADALTSGRENPPALAGNTPTLAPSSGLTALIPALNNAIAANAPIRVAKQAAERDLIADLAKEFKLDKVPADKTSRISEMVRRMDFKNNDKTAELAEALGPTGWKEIFPEGPNAKVAEKAEIEGGNLVVYYAGGSTSKISVEAARK